MLDKIYLFPRIDRDKLTKRFRIEYNNLKNFQVSYFNVYNNYDYYMID